MIALCKIWCSFQYVVNASCNWRRRLGVIARKRQTTIANFDNIAAKRSQGSEKVSIALTLFLLTTFTERIWVYLET